MNIGIRQGSMANPPMDQLFAQTAEIGFEGVELEVAANVRGRRAGGRRQL